MNFSIGDKVRDPEDREWWVLTMFPELNKIVLITTDENRSDRISYRPEDLEFIEWLWHFIKCTFFISFLNILNYT